MADDPVTAYAYDVRSGVILACKWVRLACERHLRDAERYGTKRSAGLWFDPAAADSAISFFPQFLRFYEGEFDQKPFVLEPWQQFIIGSIFGWKRGPVRRFRVAYIETAKGNGKSPMAAGIGLYGLVLDNEPGAEIYAAATKQDQAAILFRDAQAFVDGSASLQKKLAVGVASIKYDEKKSFFKPISSEHRGLDGKRPHIALIDEIHEHPDAVVIDKVRAGTKGRRQALIFEITNAGYDRRSVCYYHHEQSGKILEGLIQNDAWFAYMTGLDVCERCAMDGKTIPQEGCQDCDDWRDEKVWPKANPNLGVSIQPRYLQEQVDEAITMPSKENIVKRLNFCIWTDAETRWLPTDKWLACTDPTLRLEDFRGERCYVGLDLANKIDICAVMLVFQRGDELVTFGRYYLPEDTIRDSKIQDYRRWVREGRIIQTPGAMTDFGQIEEDLKQLHAIHPINEIQFDPHESTYLINNIMQWLGEDRCIECTQGPAKISGPMKHLEGLVYSQGIKFDGDPVLTWMMGNVVKREGRQGGPVKFYYPTKTSEENKIDGAVALIMAVDRAMLKTETASIYDSLTSEQIRERMAL